MPDRQLFDDWPERYEDWFRTPIGSLVREVEGEVVRRLVGPSQGERILDVGCGTGIFTTDLLEAGSRVVGLDISRPMLMAARGKRGTSHLDLVQADMLHLPFADGCFDKVVSVTALEFVAQARQAVDEMFRVVRPTGTVVVATLNSLSPWAARRDAKTRRGERHVLENAYYRSPTDLLALSDFPGTVMTAVHFGKGDDVEAARQTEERGRAAGLLTGAFVAVRWQKPAS